MTHINELKSKLDLDFPRLKSDQKLGKPMPPFQKPYPEGVALIDLPRDDFDTNDISLFDAIKQRKSCRKFNGEALTLNELAFLLWATQGVRDPMNPKFRTVPSAGARHPFETYLAIYNVRDIEPGLYRYLPLEHAIYNVSSDASIRDKIKVVIPNISPANPGIDKSAVTFMWTAIPYRSEWRYPGMAPKVVAQDAGHVGQNLYLAVAAIDAGACCVDGYIQQEADQLLGVDGEEEFTVYMAVVGKK